MESNPDEFTNPNEYRWQVVVSGVFARKEGINIKETGDVRGLTDAEIDALHAGFTKLARPAFDEYVMKNIFDDAEELKQLAPGGSAGSGRVQVQIKPESVMSKLKRELGL
jgi:hypothetical protein